MKIPIKNKRLRIVVTYALVFTFPLWVFPALAIGACARAIVTIKKIVEDLIISDGS